jgi:hypothetical protein
MTDDCAQISNIAMVRDSKTLKLFTSAVSATAIVSLFVVLSVQLLGQL